MGLIKKTNTLAFVTSILALPKRDGFDLFISYLHHLDFVDTGILTVSIFDSGTSITNLETFSDYPLMRMVCLHDCQIQACYLEIWSLLRGTLFVRHSAKIPTIYYIYK